VARPKTHPFHQTATRQLAFGVAFVALGALAIVLVGGALVGLGVSVATIGGALAYLGVLGRRQTAAVLLNNEAVDLIARGRIADAEALLDAVPTRAGNVRRAVGIQRALIALRRADAPAAEAQANDVLAIPMGVLTREEEAAQNTLALASRGLARAMMGRGTDALDDIGAVRAAENASPEALARAAVAQATVFAKSDDRASLARCLREARPLLEHASVRERALLRAYRRMLQAPSGGVYREAARPTETAREEPLLGEWVAKIVPQAAAFVPEAERAPQTNPLDASAPESLSVTAGSAAIQRDAAKRSRRRMAGPAFLVWAILIGLFLGIWRFVAPEPTRDTIADASSHATSPLALNLVGSVFGALVVALFVGRVYAEIRRTRRSNAALRQALRALALGDHVTGSRFLTALTINAPASIAAAAHLQLSMFEERACDMRAALWHCDTGLTKISRNAAVRALNSDILVPELIAQRAFLLAALNRDQQATAEIAALARDFPTFAFMTRSVLRVRIAQALRKIDLKSAVALARDRTPELPLSRRDEMLADTVLALSGGRLVEGEVERIISELGEDPVLGRWIDYMAPGARRELATRSRARVRIESPRAGDSNGTDEDRATGGAARGQVSSQVEP
jgi:hypothetical protein